MNIHKLITKTKQPNTSKTIKWIIPLEIRSYVKKVNANTWEIYSQEDIKIQPKEVKPLMLGVGFIKSVGIVLNSLPNSLRKKRCNLQNEVNLEDTINIMTTIANNSNVVVSIKKNELLNIVCYKKI